MENYGEPRIYYGISEEISEDIPEDIPEYPKIFSEVLRINGYPRRSSETPGYPRISLWGELPDGAGNPVRVLPPLRAAAR